MSTDDNPPPPPPPPPPSADDTPGLRARVSELTAERRDLRARVATLEAAAAESGDWKAKAEAAAATLASREAEWGDERALLRAGLADDEGIDVARTLYRRLPDADRPASIGEWVASWSAEGGIVPRAMAAYLGGGAGQPGVPRPPPPPPAGAGKQPPAAAPVDAAAIRAAREAWQAAGQPTTGPAVDRLRAAIRSPLTPSGRR
jgi:hypothetical protein